MPTPRTKRFLLAGLGLALACTLWIVAIDESWFVEECPDCHWGADVCEIRIVQRAITSDVQVFEESWDYFVTVDLNVPCEHPHKTRWHRCRFWGLCYCAAPCINGSYRLSGEGSYETLSPRVRAWAKLNPQLGPRFRRALQEGNREYIREFFRRLHADEGPPPAE